MNKEEDYRNLAGNITAFTDNTCYYEDWLVIQQYVDDWLDEIDRLNNVIEIMERYLELIADLGYDYDGLNYENDLKSLIDEMVRFAKLGRVCNTTEPIFVSKGKQYNILNQELKEEK